ncbi:molybdate ABC transporter substrate-binding protein [Sphingomonas sp. CL5.1]|uniref:molybdate ABC transporter substrate-binding protein n=1 Tax=Sphingomonas sp. CL5.1 TaxID=2653203 RepID=UPI0015828CF8|nr:molybdate ABC transporter substrate-binding protein [Sphingomonas sp. CL5.1]QKS02077.1 molybdate ABC transporter substrate-binding protein [Sphingomonas sp. CL5.1]
MRRLIALAALFLAAFVLPAAAQDRGPLVLAAASLQESMNAAADEWARAGHARPTVSFAASSALARQVLAGAAADLFVSADEEWMDALAAKGLLAKGTRADLVGNRLVVVEPARGRTRLTVGSLGTMLARGPVAMADPAAVPAGKYGQVALERLGAWAAVAPHVVRAENVRAALALVERGVAPFGIVYATDAHASAKVRVAGVFPASSHPPIRYPVARLAASLNPAAESFRRFLLSARGRAIFARFGFTRP